MSNIAIELLVLHIVVSMLYVLFIADAPKTQTVCEGIIVLLIPGFGLALLLFVRACVRWGAGRENPAYLYKDFKRDKVTGHSLMKQEANIIPIRDVLMLDDAKTKRAVLGDVIKRDILNSPEVLFTAVKDADSEISHYAVSVVTHRLAELESLLYTLKKKNAENPNNPELLRLYADSMSSYLALGKLDTISRQKLEQEYAGILAALVFFDGTDKKYFMELGNCLLRDKDYQQAAYLCQVFSERFPLSEEPYLLRVKLHYSRQDDTAIRQTIAELKQSNIRFSSQALQTVRFWDGGEQNAS